MEDARTLRVFGCFGAGFWAAAHGRDFCDGCQVFGPHGIASMAQECGQAPEAGSSVSELCGPGGRSGRDASQHQAGHQSAATSQQKAAAPPDCRCQSGLQYAAHPPCGMTPSSRKLVWLSSSQRGFFKICDVWTQQEYAMT